MDSLNKTTHKVSYVAHIKETHFVPCAGRRVGSSEIGEEDRGDDIINIWV